MYKHTPCDTEPFECPFNAQYIEDCRYYCGLGVDEDEPEDYENEDHSDDDYRNIYFEDEIKMFKVGPKDVCVGEMRYADLSPVIGNEIGGLRPVLIKEVHDDVVIVVPCVLN